MNKVMGVAGFALLAWMGGGAWSARAQTVVASGPRIFGAERCATSFGERNNLDTTQAKARWDYSVRCYRPYMIHLLRSYPTGRAGVMSRGGQMAQIYPAFGIGRIETRANDEEFVVYENSQNWFPPEGPTASTPCDPMPAGYYQVVTCFGPQQPLAVAPWTHSSSTRAARELAEGH